MIAEVLALSDLDVVCIAAEHSPFDRKDIDSSLFAYRCADKPSIVRVASGTAEHILNALDCGATGVIVPHVYSEQKAHTVAKAARYGDLGRGYAGSTRAANYTGHSVEQNLAANKENVLIAQIEDAAALEQIDAIAAVEGIDCLFIGIMDLTIALACTSPKDATVVRAAELICEAAIKNNRRTGIFVADADEIPYWQERGVSLFLTA